MEHRTHVRQFLSGAFWNGRSGRQMALPMEAPAAGTQATARAEARLEASYRNLERAIGFIEHADNKALILLALQGAIIAGLGAFADPLRQTIESQRWNWSPAVILVLLGLGLVMLAYSVFHAVLALSPRIRKSEEEPGHDKRSSPFFFGDINRMTLDTFREQMLRLDGPSIEDELIRQTHITAGIAAEKYRNVRHQSMSLAVEFAFLLLAAVLAEIGRA